MDTIRRTKVIDVLRRTDFGAIVNVKGWVRTHRSSKSVDFIALNDGSTIKNVQIVVDPSKFDAALLKQVTTGACIGVDGVLVESQGGGQAVELQCENIEVYGMCGADYPMQKKGQSFEYMRQHAHMRLRTNIFGAIMRIRHNMAMAIHTYFHEHGFYYFHTPLITASDCEGAGNMFQVTTKNLYDLKKDEDGKIIYDDDFFGQQTSLTVSGQLEGELGATALGAIYTFGPTFRAENSNTPRHLAEFWMVEPEVAFLNQEELMDLEEDFIKYCVRWALEKCKDDLEFINDNKFITPKHDLIPRLEGVLKETFVRLPYTMGIEILQEAIKNGKKFEFPVSLLSVPKYTEIDPSTILGIFFPFFFGFMVGDLGYAIPFIVLGAYGMRHAKSQEFRAIGTVLFFGGIWAAIFGFFFFGEMLGMHFIGGSNGVTVTWEYWLGIDLPDWFEEIAIESYLEEHLHYGVSKLDMATFLLKVSVYMGIVHLLLAYVIKFANVKMRDGFKEAYLEAGGWIFSFVGMIVFCYGLTQIMFGPGGFSDIPQEALIFLGVGGVVLIIGIISCFPKDGAQAILELPGIVGNILSYTRLTAIGMSKAGMALAFNYIAIIMLGGTGSVGGVIAGAAVFIIGHLMIWVLAILSAGLHGLRLQYVEMMNKFFIGGGEEYSPLAIKRKNTKNVEIEV